MIAARGAMMHAIREGCYDSQAHNTWDVQASREAPASRELQVSQVPIPSLIVACITIYAMTQEDTISCITLHFTQYVHTLMLS